LSDRETGVGRSAAPGVTGRRADLDYRRPSEDEHAGAAAATMTRHGGGRSASYRRRSATSCLKADHSNRSTPRACADASLQSSIETQRASKFGRLSAKGVLVAIGENVRAEQNSPRQFRRSCDWLFRRLTVARRDASEFHFASCASARRLSSQLIALCQPGSESDRGALLRRNDAMGQCGTLRCSNLQLPCCTNRWRSAQRGHRLIRMAITCL
jgi:hypothetical protein